MKSFLYISVIVLHCISFISLGHCRIIGPKNYFEAKQFARRIFHDHRKTFYCDCEFNQDGIVEIDQCRYKPYRYISTIKRVEFEHLMPVSYFAKNLPCWNKKMCKKNTGKLYRGRTCCQKIDSRFSLMEADLHNIVPEINELNQLRANFQFMLLPDVKSLQFGTCHFKVDKGQRAVEPRPSIRGVIARAYLYMADMYHIQLSKDERKLFEEWHQSYPPEQWEVAWDQKVFVVQGNHNRYIKEYYNTLMEKGQ